MKNRLFAFGSLLGLFLVSVAFTNPPAIYKADTAKSIVTWKGYKVTGSHEGTIDLQNGELVYENGTLKGGSFTIDMASIACTDLSGGMKGKLEGHLKSADFFGVDKYPTAKFEVTKVVSRGTPGEYKVIGNLTIKETTKEIKFMTTIDESATAPIAKADITIDRSDFDVRYGSGSFFDNLGDKTIYDEFELSIELVVNK
ncbi:MAG: YceI family protein [Bacteroidota bacterium]